MAGQTIRERLDSCKFRDLQAIAKTCKKAGLCGAYSSLGKSKLIDFLQGIPAEGLKEHLYPSFCQRIVARWRAIGALAILSVAGAVASFGGWIWPRNTVNEDLASAQRTSSEAALQHFKNEANQLEEIKSLTLRLTQKIEVE